VQILRFYVFDPFPYAQQLNQFGQPMWVYYPALAYQQLDLQYTQYGLQLLRGGQPIGIVTGMILVDASVM